MTERVLKAIIAVVLVAAGTTLGIVAANLHAQKYCYVIFSKDITLAEDVVFEDEYSTYFHGSPVIITKGAVGSITDEATYNADDAGEEFIHATFLSSDGDWIDVVLSTDMPSDNPPTLLIDIQKIESSQEVLSEYKQSREYVRSSIRNTRIIGALIGFAVSAVIVVIVFAVNRKSETSSGDSGGHTKNPSIKRIVRILTTCILMLMFAAVLANFIYLLNYQIKYDWLDPVSRVAHELYTKNFRPEKSLINFPIVFYVLPVIEAVLAFLIVKFGFKKSAWWALAIALLILLVFAVVVAKFALDYYNGFGERLESIIKTNFLSWHYDDHRVEIINP